MKVYIAAVALAFIYFIAAYLTLSDYGISWDETLHFRRGQAYLHYFLTGDLDYRKIPEIDLQGTNGDPAKTSEPRRSFYQNDFHNGEYFLKNDSGHPPLNGELAAVTNYIFFQRLGALDDISSHHLFNILASSLLVFVVVAFAIESLGIFAGIISFLALVTFPLFWAESHFNVKDPPEAAFFTAAIWAFYRSLNKKNVFWLLGSFIFLGFALGTKFNVLFVPLIIIPYLIIRYWNNLNHPAMLIQAFSKRYLLALLVGCLITVGIFIGSWPYLWQDWPGNLYKIFGYYKEIGLDVRYQPDQFFIFGFNTFPSLWILLTTPPLVLVLSAIGVITTLIRYQVKNEVNYLWLLLFLVPIARVTIPGVVIYGGIRQILEFLPGMALLSGLGAWQIYQWSKGKVFFSKVTPVILILLFIWPVLVLVKIHPNENVYFNFLIGGLPGAESRNFPSWGNSFGNAYLQGLQWLNRNTEKGAKLALIQGTTANVPIILIRSDIDYQNSNWSGINRGGEYLMELNFNDTGRDYYYAWEYVEKFLQPVYEVRVDGVPILKIWKNDLEHTKPDMKKQEVRYNGEVHVSVDQDKITILLDDLVDLSRVEIKSDQQFACLLGFSGFMETSVGDDKWVREKDQISFPQVGRKDNIRNGEIMFFFASRQAKEVRFIYNPTSSCKLNAPNVAVTVLR